MGKNPFCQTDRDHAASSYPRLISWPPKNRVAGSCGKEVRFAEVSEDSVAEAGEFLQARAAPSKKVLRRCRGARGPQEQVSDKADPFPDQCAKAAPAP
jgi:hypothetical protein